MKKYIVSTVILYFYNISVALCQNSSKLNGFWLNIQEQSIIEYYHNGYNYSFLYSKIKDSYVGGKNDYTTVSIRPVSCPV